MSALSRRRKWMIGAAIAAAALAVLATRAVWEGRGALARGDAAAAAGEVEDAIRHWRRAARWYLPLAPHVGAAYERLEAAGAAAEQAGDRDNALAAWRGVRSAALATRSFYVPHRDRLEAANRRIATLMAAAEGPAADPESSAAEREAWHLSLLERPVGPSVGWSLVAIAGFALWIGGAFWFAWCGISTSDRLVRRVAARSGLMVVVGLFVWLLGLSRA